MVVQRLPRQLSIRPGDGAAIIARCNELATISQERNRLTRPFATPAMARVNAVVGRWMTQAGMAVSQDAVGNLIGRLEGSDPDAGTLLLGSHLDTVRDAGAFDGPLGVLTAIACVERIRADSCAHRASIEVLAFSDEEGLRFGTAYLGSRAVAASFTDDLLELVDDEGVTVAQALRAFGCDPNGIAAASKAEQNLIGYCEVHIEQAPLLEERDLPVAIVRAIAGATRAEVEFTGRAGHAGTTPMDSRQDALCAAADWALAVEQTPARTPGTLATVGQLEVSPGAANVVPGVARAMLDVRHPDDAARAEAVADLREAAAAASRARRVSFSWRSLLDNQAVVMDPYLTQCLAEAVSTCGIPPFEVSSGAGHDAVALSALTGVAMLFVRCADGVSHHPAESVSEADAEVALDVLEAFVRKVCA